MNYLIAGMLNQPQYAFRFLLRDIEGGYTFAQYSALGWSVEDTARRIAHDVYKNRYNATIYTISVGDQVARYLEAMLGDRVKIVAINPCSNPKFLRPLFYYGARIVAPLFQVVCHLALGWISVIPFLYVDKCRYSLMLLADQIQEIAYGNPPTINRNTVAVICSEADEFLLNEQIIQYFSGIPTAYVPTTHGRTVEKPTAYLDAVRDLLKRKP